MKINNFFSTFNLSAAGLSSEKKQLSVTAENIANASTTRTLDGTPYKRKQLTRRAISQPVHFSRELTRARIALRTSSRQHISQPNYQARDVDPNGLSRIKTEVSESNDIQRVYEPGHPDADADGYVAYPDVNVVNEMLELISASRAYEANITVMNATKSMVRLAMDI